MVAVAVAVVPWKVCELLPAPVKSSAVPASAFESEDAILILSASGNSKNLVEAAKWVKKNKEDYTNAIRLLYDISVLLPVTII